jgi:DNA-binding transcriptional ArsR family regulator
VEAAQPIRRADLAAASAVTGAVGGGGSRADALTGAVARAIADPVRRRLLMLLRSGTMTAGEIAAGFDISRPAVSRHLRVLRRCGLVVDEVRGRQRLYRLDVAPLAALAAWLDQLAGPAGPAARGEVEQPAEPDEIPDLWPGRLDALETEVYRARRHRRAAARNRKESTA